jgi:hypothetical protein
MAKIPFPDEMEVFNRRVILKKRGQRVLGQAGLGIKI